jgi:hypothetical protein
MVVSLAALITIGLLIVGGLAIYRISWSEGFKMGQLTAGAADGVLPPSSFGYPGLLLTLGVIFLLLIVAGRFFRFWAWGPWMMAGGPGRWAGGPQAHGWARHWHRHHGHMPPWCWGWEEASGAEGEQPESEAEPGAAQAAQRSAP